MSSLQHEFSSLSVRQLCALLGVSRSWLYERPNQPSQAERDGALRDAIERIVLEFPGYGYRRVTAELHRQNWEVNHKRILRMMRAEALPCQLQRSWGTTTDSRHGLRTYPNLLAGRVLDRPNQVWVADITYVRLPSCLSYLACILDAWFRRCIGWQLSRTIDT
jgi:transposase InsO family protein